ncbi:MAG: ATP-binding protein [Candidatus Kapabacteria bacterium]|nr:ATP-binding protein [Candidatus Kapabacteria bacterium]
MHARHHQTIHDAAFTSTLIGLLSRAEPEIVAYFRQHLIVAPASSDLDFNMALAYAVVHRHNDPVVRVRVANAIAIVTMGNGSYDEARSILKERSIDCQTSPILDVECDYVRAIILMREGLLERSIALLEDCHERCQKHELPDHTVSRILNMLASLYGDLGRVEDSIRIHEQNIFVRERLGDHPSLAVAYYNYGEVWKRLEDYETAYDYILRAYTIEKAYNLTLNLVTSAGSLAAIQARLGDEEATRAFANEAVDLALQSGVGHQVVSAMLYKAEALMHVNDISGALMVLDDILSHHVTSEQPPLFVDTLSLRAEVFLNLNKPEAALADLYEAQEKLPDEQHAYAVINLKHKELRALAALGNFERLWERALDVVPFEIAQKNTHSLQISLTTIADSFAHNHPSVEQRVTFSSWMAQMLALFADADKLRLRLANQRFARERSKREMDIERLRNVELASALSRLESANADLTRLATEKDDMLSLVAHDLRSPLAGLRNHVDSILDNLGNSSGIAIARAELESMKSTINGLLTSVRTLLDLGRSNSALHLQLVDVNFVIRQATDRHFSAARSKAQRLHLSLCNECFIETEPNIVAAIIDNLLSNAVKYTPADGGITVTSTCTEDVINISVHDTGPGIPQEATERLFTRFGKLVDDDATIDSIGMGLFLSRRMAERLGGTLVHAPGPNNVGSTFTCTLPRHTP